MILERTLVLILICVSVHLKRIQANKVQGIPGVDYPNYEVIPVTSFRCSEQNYNPGLYADVETKCQVFHSCHMNRQESFLCPTGTTFNQAIRTCDYWHSSDCSLAPSFYVFNDFIEMEDDNVEYPGNFEESRPRNDLFEKMSLLYEGNTESSGSDFRDGPRSSEMERQDNFGNDGEIEFHSLVDNSESISYGNRFASSADSYFVGGSGDIYSHVTNNLQNDLNPASLVKFDPDDPEPDFRDNLRNVEIEREGNFKGGNIDSESRVHESNRFRYSNSYENIEDSYSIKENDDKHSKATSNLQNDLNPTTLVKSSPNIPKSDEHGFHEGKNLAFEDLSGPLNEKMSTTEPFNYYENDGYVETEYTGNSEHSNAESRVVKKDIQTFDEISKSTTLSKRISETEGNGVKRRPRPKTVYVVQPELEIVTLPPVIPKRNRVSLKEIYPDVSNSGQKVESSQSSDIHEVENKIKEPIAMNKTSDVSGNFDIQEDNLDQNENPAVGYQVEQKPVIDHQIERKPLIDHKVERKPVMDHEVERKAVMDNEVERKQAPANDYQVEQKQAVDYQKKQNPVRDYQIDQKADMNYQAERKSDTNFEVKRNPLIDSQVEQKPVIDYQERKPVIDYQEQKPIIDYQVERKPVTDYNVERNPITDYKVERNPVTDYKVERNPLISYQEERNPAFDYQEERNPAIDYQAERNPAIDYQEERNPVNHYLEERNPVIDYQEERNRVINYREEHKPIINNVEQKPVRNYQAEGKPVIDYQLERKPVIDYQFENKNEDFDFWFTEDYSFASGDADFPYTEDANAYDVFSDSQQDLDKNTIKIMHEAIERNNMQQYLEVERTISKSENTENPNKYISTEFTDSSYLKSNDAFHDPSAAGSSEGLFFHEYFGTGDSPSNALYSPPELVPYVEGPGTKDYRTEMIEPDVEYLIENASDTYGTKLDSYDIDYSYFQPEFDDADERGLIPVLPFRDAETYEYTDASIKAETFPEGEIDSKNIADLDELSDIYNWNDYQNPAFGEVKSYKNIDHQAVQDEALYNTFEDEPFAFEGPEIPKISTRYLPQENEIAGSQTESISNYDIHQSQTTNEHLHEFEKPTEEFINGDVLSSSDTNMVFTGLTDQNVQSTETSIDHDFERMNINDSSLSAQEILNKSSDAVSFTDSENEQVTEHPLTTPIIENVESETLYDLTNMDDLYKSGTISQNPNTEVTVSENFYSEEESTTFENKSNYSEYVNLEEKHHSDESVTEKYLEADHQTEFTNEFYSASEIGYSFSTAQPDIPEVSSRPTPQKMEVYSNDNLGMLKLPTFDDARLDRIQKTVYTELLKESDNDFEHATDDSLHLIETTSDRSFLSDGLEDHQTLENLKVTSAVDDFEEQNTSSLEGFVELDSISQDESEGRASTPLYPGKEDTSEDSTLKESNAEHSVEERNITEENNGNFTSNIEDASLNNSTQASLNVNNTGESDAKERVVRQLFSHLFHRPVSSSPPPVHNFPTRRHHLVKSVLSDRARRLDKFPKISTLASFAKDLMAIKKAKVNLFKKIFHIPIWDN